MWKCLADFIWTERVRADETAYALQILFEGEDILSIQNWDQLNYPRPQNRFFRCHHTGTVQRVPCSTRRAGYPLLRHRVYQRRAEPPAKCPSLIPSRSSVSPLSSAKTAAAGFRRKTRCLVSPGLCIFGSVQPCHCLLPPDKSRRITINQKQRHVNDWLSKGW